MRLSGKTALITGTGSGIGKAIALMFAREGADLALNDINEKTAKATAEEARTSGVKVVTVPADIASFGQAREMARETLTEFKRIDILVNNAGIVDYRAFTEITEEAWDWMLTINLKGAFNCTQAVIGTMIERRSGAIVNIASVAGTTGTPYHTHYSAAKGGLVGLTKALAKEIAQYGIRVNAVAPAVIETPAGKRAREYYGKMMPSFSFTNPPLGFIGQPEDVAAACIYLASDEARYVTGQVLSPNGGSWI
jgi:3-oxoacyl-[acyl-carrier protein] reductase